MAMKQKGIVLVGGGGHCRSLIEAAESAGLKIAGILERPDVGTKEILGYPVLGDDDLIRELAANHEFVVTVGFVKSPAIRRKLHQRIIKENGRLAKIIASTAYVSPHAEIGAGSVVLHHATVNASAKIGMGCIVNTAADIEHDVRIGDECHISTGVMVNGGSVIGNRVFIGSGTVVTQGVRICDDAVIGAGSLVLHDVKKAGVIFGVI